MNDKLGQFIKSASPLIAVQFLLAIINIFVIAVSGSFVPWAMIPIAAMGIPEFVMFANAFFGEDSLGDPNAASSKLKRFLRRAAPLLGTQFLLAMINLFVIIVSGSFVPWAAIPIAAIGIPEFIIFANTFFSNNTDADMNASTNVSNADSEQNDAQAEARREARRAADGARVGTPLADVADSLASAGPVESAEAQFDFNVETDVSQARRYKQQIDALIKANPNSNSRMTDISTQVNEWVKIVETMAARITAFRRNQVIESDLAAVPKAVSKLEAQIAEEQDERVKLRLQQTLATRQNQLVTLKQLASTMRQAEIQLESTVASLGTIYSQVLTAQSTNQVADYSHLAAHVSEQVHQLQDQIEAIEEVRLGGNLG